MIKAFLSADPVVTIGAAPTASSGINLEAANMGIGGAGITALLGYAVVFFGLVLLMAVIALFGKVMAEKKKEQPAAAPAAPAAASVVAETKPDPGVKDGARVCDLNGVDDKTAAMIMAIVADKTGIPLNELRFISIKEL